MPLFEKLSIIPSDPIFGLISLYDRDERKNKINLTVGYCHNELLEIPVFSSVKQAEKILFSNEKNKGYLPIDGLKNFNLPIAMRVFGKDFFSTEQERITIQQTVGGTSALFVLGRFIFEKLHKAPLYLPNPTWPNHLGVFKKTGLEIAYYPYCDSKGQKLLFDEMQETLSKAPTGSYVLLHASCHNPSGLDLSLDQWKTLVPLFKKRALVPFFDCAYHGLGSSLEEDVASIRLFAKEDFDLFVAYSCSKNFSLYGERLGASFVVSQNAKQKEALDSLLKQFNRAIYSNPPRHGALIVAQILEDSNLCKTWENELLHIRTRVQGLREQLAKGLQEKTKKPYPHILKGRGLFCFTGLEEASVVSLREKSGIYLTKDGRMNITGLNDQNIDQVMTALSSFL
jgi:aspartate/tyrosine/aromatic aminotransferase